MKCIQDKCGYYHEHNFRASCFVCGLSQQTKSKNEPNSCDIISQMVKQKHMFLYIIEELENIEKNQ